MKKLINTLIIAALLLALAACSFNAGPTENKAPEETQKTGEAETPQEAADIGECELDPRLMKQLGLENVMVLSSTHANIRNAGDDDRVYFLCSYSIPCKADPATLYELKDGLYYEAGEESLYDDPSFKSGETMQEYLLFVNNDAAPVLKNVTPYNQAWRKHAVDIYANDLDGDGLDEIVIQQGVDATGGFGQYYSMIYDCDGGEINRVFKTDSEYLWNRDLAVLPGADGALAFRILGSDYEIKLRVKQEWNSQYRESFGNDYIDDIVRDYKDRTVKLDDAEYFHVWCDSCWRFDVRDVDNDGICEIEFRRYCSLISHVDFIGELCGVLRYDAKTQKYVVSDCRFEYSENRFEPQ